MRLALALLCTTVACGDKDQDTAGARSASLEIVAPTDGTWMDEGDSVHLLARVHAADGTTSTPESVSWAAEGSPAGTWTTAGNDVDVTDLPAGTLDLSATADDASTEGPLNETPLTDTVTIYVYAVTGDSGE